MKNLALALCLGLISVCGYAADKTHKTHTTPKAQEANSTPFTLPMIANSFTPTAINSPTPNESFDPTTGNIQLNYNDIVLPGNGSLPIVIRHSYNHLNGAARDHLIPISQTNAFFGSWDVGMNVPQIIGDVFKGFSDAFFLQLPNSHIIKMYTTDKTYKNFVSYYNWKAQLNGTSDSQTILLTSPQGTQYNYRVTTTIHLANILWIKDTHGNRIDFNYVSKRCGDNPGNDCSFVNKIVANDGREVDFTYSDPTIFGSHTMTVTANGKSWIYYFNPKGKTYLPKQGPFYSYQLTGVKAPDGRLWTYWYTSDDSATLRDVKNPEGLTTRYEFDSCHGNPSTLPADFKGSLCAKAVFGPNVPMESWSYHYQDATNGGYTTVSGKYGTTQYHYQIPGNNSNLPSGQEYPLWRFGLIDKIQTLKPDNVTEVRRDEFTYTAKLLANLDDDCVTLRNKKKYCSSYIYAPMVESRTTYIPDQGTYTTKYSNFSNHLRPQHIEETGDNQQTKTTDLTYFANDNLNIIGGIATKKVNNLSVENNTYDTNTGDLLNHEIFGVPTTYTYDTQGNLSTITDANQHTTTFSNYFRGTAQTTKYPDGTSSSKIVNPTGTIQSSTDANGHTTSYEYDGTNRPLLITTPKQVKTTISYDNSESGQGGNTKTQGNYKIITKVDSLGRTIEIDKIDTNTGTTLKQIDTYDEENRLQFKSYFFNPTTGNSALGHYYSYDAINRPLSVCAPTATQYCTNYIYQAGDKVSVTDPNGHTTTSTRLAYGNPNDASVIQIDQPEGITTKIDRDAFGHINTITQGSLQRKNTYYPNTFFLKTITYPEIGTTSFTYDNVGNLLTKNIGSLTTTYHYDELNNLKQVEYSDGTAALNKTYYPAGQVKTVSKGNINQTYTYDADDNLTDENINVGSKNFKLHYDYDDLDNLKDIVYPDNKQVDYTPDAFGNDTQVGDFVKSIQYYPSGTVASMQYGNGINATTSLNQHLLPETIAFTKDKLSLSRTYHYDNGDNIQQIEDPQDTSYNLVLGYDGVNRLTSASGKWGQGSIQYNTNGDITHKQLGNDSLDYSIDSNGVLKSVSGASTRTFSYDPLGNVSNNGHNQFSYGLDGNLTTVKDASGTLLDSYQYDGNGQRLLATSQGKPTYSLYNQAGTLMYQLESDNSSKDFIYLNGNKIAQIENTPNNTKVTYFHNNLLGSPIAATDQSGNLLWQQHYQPFGSRQDKTIGPDNPQWYTGKVEDKDDGLMYYGARYYDPEIGRFMAIDPVGVDPSNPITFNRYAYAADNPYLYTDPNGMESITEFGNDVYNYTYDALSGFNAGASFGALDYGYNSRAVYTEWAAVGAATSLGAGRLAAYGTEAIQYGAQLYNGIRNYFSGSTEAEGTSSISWPPNRGFQGEITTETLQTGTQIDRYGLDYGTFTSPKGTPFELRSLPQAKINDPYNAYEVLKPIEGVSSGEAAPWFGQPGGGTQYELPNSVRWHVENGYLRPID